MNLAVQEIIDMLNKRYQAALKLRNTYEKKSTDWHRIAGKAAAYKHSADIVALLIDDGKRKTTETL